MKARSFLALGMLGVHASARAEVFVRDDIVTDREFRKYGLMRHHRVEDRATRGWFVAGWPHTTAAESEVALGRLWAVDSWFLGNGEPPFVFTAGGLEVRLEAERMVVSV